MDKLQKRYGLLTAICMVVGIVIGSGVFFKAQTILQKTGGNMPLGILAWIIGGVIMQERTRNSRQDSLYSRFRYQDGSGNGVDSDRKSTRLNSSHRSQSRMPSSA